MVRHYLENELQLQVNPKMSAVARPSERDFLDDGLFGRQRAKLKVAAAGIQRLRGRVKDVPRARTEG